MSVEEQAVSLDLTGLQPVEPPLANDRKTRQALIAFGYYFALAGLLVVALGEYLPDRIAVTFFGHDFAVENLRRHLVRGGTLGLIVMPGAFAVELAVVGWFGSSLRHLLFAPSASSRSDLAAFVLAQTHALNLCRDVLTFGGALLSGVWLHDYLRAHAGIDLGLSGAPALVVYPAYFMLFTFFDYWTHRLDHTRLFWPIHRYHHSAREFCILTSDRSHPANITAAVATVVPLGLLNAPPQVAFWIYLVVGAQHLLIHSRIRPDLGWIGRYIVQSPAHHRLHHTIDTTRPAANFGLLPVWDRLFGTWRAEVPQSVEIGVSDPYRHGLWIVPDLWRDYREFLAGFFPRRAVSVTSPEMAGRE